jgi:GNAT superfamily N-acetyltransferase
VQFGLTLKRGYREREVYHILTDPLLTAAMDLARRRGINTMNIHLRSTDTGHPPVMLELGFREHRVSMLGFSHDLKYIPPRLLPPGFSFRLARLPDENATVLQLLNAAFDDRDRQGEPLGNTYLDFISGKSGFEPEQVQFVEGGGSPIGCIIADAATHEPGSTYTVLELAVLADYRRRGIGSALLCRQLEWLRTRGARTALASMFSSNVAATLFWRLGFRPDPQKTFRFFLRDTATPSTADQGGNHDALL